MSATSGYIAFPEDFIPIYSGGPTRIISKSRYDFLTAAAASGKVGKIFVPGVGTLMSNHISIGELSGYLMGVPGATLILIPLVEEVEDGVVYGIVIGPVDASEGST